MYAMYNIAIHNQAKNRPVNDQNWSNLWIYLQINLNLNCAPNI